jgi:hypothetical protein
MTFVYYIIAAAAALRVLFSSQHIHGQKPRAALRYE